MYPVDQDNQAYHAIRVDQSILGHFHFRVPDLSAITETQLRGMRSAQALIRIMPAFCIHQRHWSVAFDV